jgi:hypothetical protein
MTYGLLRPILTRGGNTVKSAQYFGLYRDPSSRAGETLSGGTSTKPGDRPILTRGRARANFVPLTGRCPDPSSRAIELSQEGDPSSHARGSSHDDTRFKAVIRPILARAGEQLEPPNERVRCGRPILTRGRATHHQRYNTVESDRPILARGGATLPLCHSMLARPTHPRKVTYDPSSRAGATHHPFCRCAPNERPILTRGGNGPGDNLR